MASQPPRFPKPENDWNDRSLKQPIRDTLPTRPVTTPSGEKREDTSFKTFGLLPETHQSKGASFTALVLNALLVLVAVILSTQAKKILVEKQKVDISKLVPVEKKDLPKPKPPELPKPKIPPPVVKVEPPKIELPKVEVPEPPKIQTPVMQAKPVPVITPPAPRAVTPPPAPKVIAINNPQAASVANHDAHPSPVRLGNMTNPINSTTGPAVSKINLGHSGAAGMPASNTGMGPASRINIAGSGAPGSQNVNGHGAGAVVIKGLANGTPGGTGNGPRTSAVMIARNNTPAPIQQAVRPAGGATTPPKVLFKPRPEYTAEARQMHLEGSIAVRIHVTASGQIQVLGISGGGLGHGLNEAAIAAVRGMRFQPAMRDGQPVDWDGTVNITFQLA